MQDHIRIRKTRKPVPGTHVESSHRRDAICYRRDSQTRGNRGSERCNATSNENFCPGYARLIKQPGSHVAHPAAFRERRNSQRLSRDVIPLWRGEPSKSFLNQWLAIAPIIFPPDNRCIERLFI